MTTNLKKAFLFLLFYISVGYAQDGSVDLTFNTPIHPTAPVYNGFIGEIYATKILSSGKILVYGSMTAYMGNPVKNLVRLNPNGSVDTTFNVGTGPNTVEPSYKPNSNLICEQPDGKIILGGPFSTYNGVSKNKIVRLNTDGTIDTSFGIGTGFSSYVYTVKLQSDGKILCGGYFTTYNGTAVKNMARLNADGTIDTSFNPGTGAYHPSFSEECVYAIETQPDGKILVGGRFTTFNSVAKNALIRLQSNGTVDNTFLIGTGAGTNDKIVKIFYNTLTNKIFIAGKISTFNGTAQKNIISLNADGTNNSAFNPGTNVSTNSLFSGITDFAMLNSGKVLVCGDFQVGTYYDLFLYNADGTDDTSFKFENAQALNNPEIYTLAVDSSNGIYAAGYFQNVNGNDNDKGSIVKIFTDGSTDITFNPNFGTTAGFGSGLNALKLNNGKLLIGVYESYNERFCNSITINQDGSIYQTDFANYLNLNLNSGYAILSNDNKVYLTPGIPGFIYKINENGTPDNSFTSTSAIYTLPTANVHVYDIEQQADNRILIAGWFRLTNGNYQSIARLNTNGTVDGSFAVGNGFYSYDNRANDMVILPDNKIVVVGEFDQYNGTLNLGSIVRINTNGSIDNTFSSGTGFNNDVDKVILTSNNKLLICGRFTQYNNVVSPYVIRLNLDGSIDTTFSSPFAVGDFYTDSDNIVLQPNGKCLMGIYYNGAQKLYRLNTNGSIDNTFSNITFSDPSGTTCSGMTYDKISSITLLQNKVLLTGCFGYLNGYRRVGIAMLNNSESLLGNNNIPENETMVSIAPNPVENILTLTSNKTFDRIEIYSIEGRKLLSGQLTENSINIDVLKPNIYLAKVISPDGTKTIKFIKR